jgi:hypothetical protein
MKSSKPGRLRDTHSEGKVNTTFPPKNGSEQESVTRADFMRVLVFGKSGYTPEDEGIGLEQGTGVAWV